MRSTLDLISFAAALWTGMVSAFYLDRGYVRQGYVVVCVGALLFMCLTALKRVRYGGRG